MRSTNLFVFLILLALAIPWYWNAEIRVIFMGFPIWVITAIAVSLATSTFVAFLLRKPWDQESSESEDE
ncbi:MAG: hypothetical protein VX986_02600 [Pseudomonadota bacterium]|nr:hypothetical protein [Pseudomonadota bacterium]